MHKTNLLASLLATVVLFSAVIGIFYAFLVPYFWPAYKTYSVLVVGVIAAAMTGGYLLQRTGATSFFVNRIVLTLGGGLGIGALVLFISLFIILNTRGG